MNKLLLVIDAQKDFINENTKPILLKIEELINENKFEYIAFTRFLNYIDSNWYKKLKYNGCLTEEEQEIVIDTKGYKIFDKKIYSCLSDELKKYLLENNIEEIYLCGFDTDACVSKTALDLFENNYNVYILKDYCMSHESVELHDVYINNLARLIGKDKIV
ncbi:MAG: isochorismatase family protein [Bacilli bacterium]|nr:isochorismatase family protein [Bacilli bacterium]